MNKFQPFTELLNRYVTRKGVNKSWLAKHTGVTAQTIGNYLNGLIKTDLDCHFVLGLAQLLELTLAEQKELLMIAGCQQIDTVWLSKTEPLVPFLSRPILHPRQFFGRTAQLTTLFEGWRRSCLQHFAIIGPKQSGKSSLLNYIRYIHSQNHTTLRPGQRYNWLDQTYQWILVDFNEEAMRQPETLLRYILASLQLPVPERCNFWNFKEVLRGELTRPTVILMDNLEKGWLLPELGETFWTNMRALGCNCANLGFGVTSRLSVPQWYDATKNWTQSSPFGNIFQHLILGPLTEEEARELISYAPVTFAEEEIQWLLEQSQGWPVLLQMLCQVRLESNSKDKDGWQQQGLEKLTHYEFLWCPRK